MIAMSKKNRLLKICTFLICVPVAARATAQQIDAPKAQLGTVSGTEVDVNNGIVAGAAVVLEGPVPEEHHTVVANDNGFFEFHDVRPETPYHVTISADGYVNWTSSTIILNPGQVLFLTNNRLKIAGAATSVTVFASEEIAIEQVRIEEKQRVLGVIPNFYVSYDHDAAPLTTRLKLSLALRADTDPVTFLGVGFLAGIDQAAVTPNYGQGAKGYGQRMGALYANGFTDIMIGGAILPSLLHQDPRYFYQGTGTKKSRAFHALSSPFICRGDNGRSQLNYSSIGGDLASGAISNAYYPTTNRGPGLVFLNAAITTAGRMANGVIQEFVLRKLTPTARNQN
jgi:hypothetical protein